MSSGKLRAAVVGASGYTGEKLVKILCGHPRIELAYATSRQHAGRALSEVFPELGGRVSLRFAEPDPSRIAAAADVAFLALPHGESGKLAGPLLQAGLAVLDLSADLRLKDRAVYREYYGVDAPEQGLIDLAPYGSPETNREAIAGARLIAVPGCYPTSVLLALAPAMSARLLDPNSIIVASASSPTGAGRKVDPAYLFAECHENVRAYGVLRHRHTPEMEQELSRVGGERVTVQFIPHLVPLNAGIHTTVIASCRGELPGQAGLDEMYRGYYARAPFVRVCVGGLPEVRRVAGTNVCEVAARVDERTGRLLFFSAEDNLVKGAAGQAVQCLNVMRGWPEEEGLAL
ncbi:MAG TPA: N-acetyl-gamma-glutamyl-phosphate reductase [Verrucomicrobiae bacterium]|nr:N-acetyl-gamma-glutamyl-phosphate reductase [Verrucomicrobiae bacterium]